MKLNMYVTPLKNSITQMENKIKIGVIGTGWWGKNIVNTLERFKTISHIYIYDENKETYGKFRNLTKIIETYSIESIENNHEISAVCIATPPHTHYHLSKLFLSANKHVLVEKPPVENLSELDDLESISRNNNRIYMLDALFLFLAPIMKLREFIHSNGIGEIKLVEIFRNGDEFRRQGAGYNRIYNTMYSNGVSVIDDLFFHDCGILINLFNKLEIISVEKYFIYNKNICDSVKVKFISGKIPIELIQSWTFSRKRGIKIYTNEYIIEYDGFAEKDQLSVFNIHKEEFQYYNFKESLPLSGLLQYFIENIQTNLNNSIGFQFMRNLVSIWLDVKDNTKNL